mgnify:FL=1
MSGKGREDRRVGRTKRRLKAALLELITERGYDAITISDLTDRADVGRSTFYSHFDSKEDLLFAGFDRWVLTLGTGGEGAPRPSPARYAFSLPLLRHIRQQRSFFDATMVRSGDPRIRRRITRLLSERVEGELAEELPHAQRTARARAVVGAFMGLVVWWLEEAPSTAVEDVDRIFRASVA